MTTSKRAWDRLTPRMQHLAARVYVRANHNLGRRVPEHIRRRIQTKETR